MGESQGNPKTYKQMKLLGIEINIYKEPIKYEISNHWNEIIAEKLKRIDKKAIFVKHGNNKS